MAPLVMKEISKVFELKHRRYRGGLYLVMSMSVVRRGERSIFHMLKSIMRRIDPFSIGDSSAIEPALKSM